MKERGCRLQRLGTDFTISLPRHLNRSLKMQPSVSPIKWYNLSERETEISGLFKATEEASERMMMSVHSPSPALPVAKEGLTTTSKRRS